MRPKKTRLLKLEYQRILGKQVPISTWNWVKRQLNINDDDDLSQVQVVRAFANLRKKAPLTKFTRLDAEQYIWLSETLPRLYCTGSQLKEALMRLDPQPSTATIYRWGKEIGCGFSLTAKYTPSDLEKWLEKVLISRFTFNVRTLQKDG